mgnify:CR=1 FL=1
MEALKAVWSRFWFAITSTKYQVMIAGTVAFFTGQMNQWGWLALAGWFVGANIIQKAVMKDGGTVEMADQEKTIQTGGTSQYLPNGSDDDNDNPAAGAKGFDDKSMGFKV